VDLTAGTTESFEVRTPNARRHAAPAGTRAIQIPPHGRAIPRHATSSPMSQCMRER
jgi:hypothetical protein